jgi:hypothetical protein
MPTDVGTIGDLFDEISAMLGGYFRKPLIDLTDAPTTDVWQLDSECRSRDPYFVNRASRGDSKILRENLKDAKCGCEEEYRKWSDAHHLVEKGDRMIDAQEILEDCGIGIDDAINGVCLPRYNVVVDHANSEALSHQQSGLTGGAYRRELTRRLQEARGNGAECDVEAVEEVLISYRDALLRGDFWEVFF